MRCLFDTTTDPYYNLAAEEFLLTELEEPVFRLWRNAPAVIVGRNQNALAEINADFVRTRNIPVVRRLTGGGAVFHDLGNLNFTFIERRREGEDTAAMFRRFTAPILDALRDLGVDARLHGRNDLLIGERKFSGNAICVHRDRVLQHGTLLFSASIGDLSGALNTRPEKFADKSVKSNVSRVTNISEHLARPMDIGEFFAFLQEWFLSRPSGSGEEFRVSAYTPEETAAIRRLRDRKYATDEWNYGQSPRYDFFQSRKLPCGFIEVHLNVRSGRITECRIQGDYFFTRPTAEAEQALTGLPHRREDIDRCLTALPLDELFGTVDRKALLELFI